MKQNAGSVAFAAVLVVLVTLASPATAGVGTAHAPGGSDASSTGPAVVSQADDGNSTNASETTPGWNDTNASDATFGARLSSFMAASAADAENEIESGMFDARFERSNASERARLVQQRTEHIGARIEKLHEQRQGLLDQEELTARERALAVSLAVRANGLERSIDATVETAARINVSINQTVIEELRASANNLTGREVMSVAGGPVGLVRSGADDPGPPDDVPGKNGDEKDGTGPPNDVPGQSGDSELGNPNSGGNGGGGPNGVQDDGTPTPTPEPEDGDAN